MGFEVEIERVEDYQFMVKFDKEEMGGFLTDETTDIGGDEKGPDPSRLLGAAALNCLMASLTYCLNKKRVELRTFKGRAKGTIERLDGQLRITGLEITLHPEINSDDVKKLEGCKKIFMDYCTVTQSIRNGIDVKVSVEPEV